MKKGLALATFIIGIISLLCGIAATIFGAVSMGAERSEHKRPKALQPYN